ncbi:MAG: hypothetical protein L6R40_008450 [Gallowayella cf. fulva]|nr:MAG: hypothetical protein L6R40_008450 [Xanthomendoza cf. fulva]
MELELTLWQRFQSLKNYIKTELRNILAAYPGETEQVANEIDSLASYIKDNLECNGSNAVAHPALVAMAANDRQDVISYAEPAIPTANSLSDSCQPNNGCVAQDESVILNHHPVVEVDFDRVSTASIHSDNARSEHRSDENGQNEEPPVQSLSLISDNNSVPEKQVGVEAASERISLAMEREDMDEEPLGQDVKEQGERGPASADRAWGESYAAKSLK